MASPSKSNVSGIVLAGGQSRRLGQDKTLERLGGQTLVQRVIDQVSQLTNETIIAVADQFRVEKGHVAGDHQAPVFVGH